MPKEYPQTFDKSSKYPAPEPEYIPRCTSNIIKYGRRQIELFLSIGDVDKARAYLARFRKAKQYLRSNFPASAIARGPIQG